MAKHEGQRTDVPAEPEADPAGEAATPPSRDPEHPDATAPQDLNAAARSEPDPPEGTAGP